VGWVPDVEWAGSYIAIKLGYYAAQGVNVTLLPGGPSSPVEPVVVSGKALVGISDPAITAGAIAKGANLKIVATLMQRSPYSIISLAKTPIRTPRDMYGKKIGVQAANLTTFKTFCKLAKIDVSKLTIALVSFDPTPLADGQVDGWVGFVNDDLCSLEGNGYACYYFLWADYGYKQYANTYCVSASSLSDKTRRKQLVAFFRGEALGWKKNIEDPALGVKLTLTDFGKTLGLKASEQSLSNNEGNKLYVGPATKAHGLLWIDKDGITETVEDIKRGGTPAKLSNYDTSLIEEVYSQGFRVRA
jgi:ABC-type nitrate/sulfonate/bicarbonate transport system substrate-binding protein